MGRWQIPLSRIYNSKNGRMVLTSWKKIKHLSWKRSLKAFKSTNLNEFQFCERSSVARSGAKGRAFNADFLPIDPFLIFEVKSRCSRIKALCEDQSVTAQSESMPIGAKVPWDLFLNKQGWWKADATNEGFFFSGSDLVPHFGKLNCSLQIGNGTMECQGTLEAITAL